MEHLSNLTVPSRIERPIKIMQFGAGNFQRAFTDWMIEILNEQTHFNGDVVIVKPTSAGNYEELRRQNGLYHVVLNGLKTGQVVSEQKLITCVQQIVNPYLEWIDYLKLAENPEIRFIISNTTEAGIKFSPSDKLESAPPHEFPGKLTAWLFHRFQYFKGDPSKACIILPLELVNNNSQLLKSCILRYASSWNLSEQFINWIEFQVFCNTLVDRIVSGYPEKKSNSIHNKLGLEDKLLVEGEYYHSWIIQDQEGVSKELPFSITDLNVKFVKDLDAHRKIKVRILNGAHTSLVPVGVLFGIDYVNDAMEHEVVGPFIQRIIYDEICPTLDGQVEALRTFSSETIDRFRNPHLQHALISISLNSITKFKTRILPSILEYKNRKGALPPKLVFAFAALLAFYRGQVGTRLIPLNDTHDVMDFFKKQWVKVSSNESSLADFVRIVLSHQSFWDCDLSKVDQLEEQITLHLENIFDKGIQEAIKQVL